MVLFHGKHNLCRAIWYFGNRDSFVPLLKKGAYVSWGRPTPHTLGRSPEVFISDGN